MYGFRCLRSGTLRGVVNVRFPLPFWIKLRVSLYIFLLVVSCCNFSAMVSVVENAMGGVGGDLGQGQGMEGVFMGGGRLADGIRAGIFSSSLRSRNIQRISTSC